jgi:hypothetical protein
MTIFSFISSAFYHYRSYEKVKKGKTGLAEQMANFQDLAWLTSGMVFSE